MRWAPEIRRWIRILRQWGGWVGGGRRPSVLKSDTRPMGKCRTSTMDARTKNRDGHGLRRQPGSRRMQFWRAIDRPSMQNSDTRTWIRIIQKFGNQIRGLGRSNGIQRRNQELGLGRNPQIGSQWAPRLAPSIGGILGTSRNCGLAIRLLPPSPNSGIKSPK